MQKILTGLVLTGALLAPSSFVSSAAAGGCGAIIAPVRPATCVYQGDRIAQQWASYDGPALIAPQDTYAPSPTVGVYVRPERLAVDEYGLGLGVAVPVSEPVRVVNPARNGKPQVVKARAEVKIYNPQRMDIHLYRQ